MKRQTLIILVIPALILFFAATFIVATEYGSISGQITDSQTKQPLIGATVLLVGTYRRAQTDVHGKFTILRVSPGTYALKISAVGYSELLIKNVNVRTDLTVVVNNSLTPRTDELKDKIVVESERDIIDKFQTSNQTIIKKETIERQPVQTVDELIEKKAGVVTTSTGEVYIRGGRAFEVGYIVDGAPRAGVSSEDQAPEIGCKTPPAAKGKEVIQPSVPCMPPRRADYFPHVQGFQDMFFENYGHNPFESTSGDYKSTFAIDVDDASYTLCRSYLNQSALPPADAIRTEEFINHFDYNYPEPHNETFSVSLEGAPSRFGTNAHLLRIGIKGKTVDEEVRRSANLVFIVDVSGSMQWGNRINLLRETLHLLTEQLDRNDCVGIISYDETARIVLEPSPARNRKPIHQAINRLTPGGSTNAQAGLQLGFQMAAEIFNGSRINRVFLFSDGVANVGNTDPEALLREIKGYTDRGITLSTIGVGMGNYNDVLLEKLGDKGNGFYAYVDNIEEARSVFQKNLSNALQVIARDVKVQVEFDPEYVSRNRLLGYENRKVDDHQFRNDCTDGGEIGPGHSVTALYEINIKSPYERPWLNDSPDNQDLMNIGHIFIRYKNPANGCVEEVNGAIPYATFKHRFVKGSPDFKLATAAAEFGEIMRDSYWAKNSSLNDVLQLASEVYRQTGKEDVREFVELITKARDLRALESDYFSKE